MLTWRDSRKRRDLLRFPNKLNSLPEAAGVEVKVGAEGIKGACSGANQPPVGSSFAPSGGIWVLFNSCDGRDNSDPADRRSLGAQIISRAWVHP